MTQLRDAVADAAFTFVVGKGGTGKTTAAGALALELADEELDTHLISTDPAHSLGDLFETKIGGDIVASDCTARLTLEELDASSYADAWLGRSLDDVVEIIEAGTYLDSDDVLAFSRLALPGLDELMAVLRLADLTGEGRRVIVDTAPTGHTLRLLDAAATHEGVARALRAMADKAAAVAGSFARRAVRLTGERVIDELERYVDVYREQVLRDAAFVIATRAETVVLAETARLRAELDRRELRTVAAVCVQQRGHRAVGDIGLTGITCIGVPQLERATGCTGLRSWRDALTDCDSARTADVDADAGAVVDVDGADQAAAYADGSADDWLHTHAPRVLLFAGKGGVGKSTCAAAAALALADTRDVLLCSTDPAGSLDDVFGSTVTDGQHIVSGLRVLQIDPQAELSALREVYQADVADALDRLGLARAAEMDRRVIDALWELAPPGIDEVAALTSMLNNAGQDETVVFDTAPTGHFLRLLSMPGLALDWTRQLMRVVVKYGLAGGGGGAAEALLRLARDLHTLQQALHAADETGVVVVTLDDALVRAETERLEHALHDAGVRVLARLVNRTHHGSVTATVDAAVTGTRIFAPAVDAPIGEHALREFIAAWKIVA
ncbi:hypothetical protein BH23GEM10_BH23GEM10_00450 [soil metagenome]